LIVLFLISKKLGGVIVRGKDLIKKIKELGIEKEVFFSKDYMSETINSVEIKNEKIVLR
jgi:hypothetical protein